MDILIVNQILQLSYFHLNKQRPDCIGHEWKLDFDNIDNELVINP